MRIFRQMVVPDCSVVVVSGPLLQAGAFDDALKRNWCSRKDVLRERSPVKISGCAMQARFRTRQVMPIERTMRSGALGGVRIIYVMHGVS